MILLRILINLLGLLSRALVYPVFLLRQFAFPIVIVGGIVYIFMQFTGADTPSPAASSGYGQNAAPVSVPQSRINPESAVSPVLKTEDGNSVFSEDLLTRMRGDEADYYGRIFYGVMDKIPDNTAYPWQFGDIAGSLTPTKTFTNGRGDTCRNFEEILKVHTVQQTISGVACHRGDGSWCKLRKSNTPACGLHTKGSFWEGIKNSLF